MADTVQQCSWVSFLAEQSFQSCSLPCHGISSYPASCWAASGNKPKHHFSVLTAFVALGPRAGLSSGTCQLQSGGIILHWFSSVFQLHHWWNECALQLYFLMLFHVWEFCFKTCLLKLVKIFERPEVSISRPHEKLAMYSVQAQLEYSAGLLCHQNVSVWVFFLCKTWAHVLTEEHLQLCAI